MECEFGNRKVGRIDVENPLILILLDLLFIIFFMFQHSNLTVIIGSQSVCLGYSDDLSGKYGINKGIAYFEMD